MLTHIMKVSARNRYLTSLKKVIAKKPLTNLYELNSRLYIVDFSRSYEALTHLFVDIIYQNHKSVTTRPSVRPSVHRPQSYMYNIWAVSQGHLLVYSQPTVTYNSSYIVKGFLHNVFSIFFFQDFTNVDWYPFFIIFKVLSGIFKTGAT